jgi:hypothetical protein
MFAPWICRSNELPPPPGPSTVFLNTPQFVDE